MNQDKRIAILMTYARPDAENRLKTQLSALQSSNFEVHTLGLGSLALPGVTRHIQITEQSDFLSPFKKALIHLFRKPRDRFGSLRVSDQVTSQFNGTKYDLVVAHDLELLPLILDSKLAPEAFKEAKKQVDLHELHDFTSPVSGLLEFFWRVLRFRLLPYHNWLLSFLKSNEIDIVTVVNQSIGEWYVNNGYLSHFSVIRNCAPYSELNLELRDNRPLKFLYHGKTDKKRGLDNLVELASNLNPGDTMNFLLTGNPKEIRLFREWASKRSSNVVFHDSVPMEKVPEKISEFDIEIIYFEPVTKNLSLTLPNKFFEAIQGRLAILAGPSPELSNHIKELGVGLSTKEWGLAHLSLAAKSLDRTRVDQMRTSSHKASSKVNSRVESEKLKDIWRLTFKGDV